MEKVTRLHRLVVVWDERTGALKGAHQESWSGVIDDDGSVFAGKMLDPEPLTLDALREVLRGKAASALVDASVTLAEMEARAVQAEAALAQCNAALAEAEERVRRAEVARAEAESARAALLDRTVLTAAGQSGAMDAP